jgi:hypothetical protein
MAVAVHRCLPELLLEPRRYIHLCGLDGDPAEMPSAVRTHARGCTPLADMLSHLIQLGAAPQLTDGLGQCMLSYAARLGECSMWHTLISRMPKLVSRTPYHAGRVLMSALQEGVSGGGLCPNFISKMLADLAELYAARDGEQPALFLKHLNEPVRVLKDIDRVTGTVISRPTHALCELLGCRDKCAPEVVEILLDSGVSVRVLDMVHLPDLSGNYTWPYGNTAAGCTVQNALVIARHLAATGELGENGRLVETLYHACCLHHKLGGGDEETEPAFLELASALRECGVDFCGKEDWCSADEVIKLMGPSGRGKDPTEMCGRLEKGPLLLRVLVSGCAAGLSALCEVVERAGDRGSLNTGNIPLLILAIMCGTPPICGVLLRHGAEVLRARTSYGSCLEAALSLDPPQHAQEAAALIVQALLRQCGPEDAAAHELLESPDTAGVVPVQRAIDKDAHAFLTLLARFPGVRANAFHVGQTPLRKACMVCLNRRLLPSLLDAPRLWRGMCPN